MLNLQPEWLSEPFNQKHTTALAAIAVCIVSVHEMEMPNLLNKLCNLQTKYVLALNNGRGDIPNHDFSLDETEVLNQILEDTEFVKEEPKNAL